MLIPAGILLALAIGGIWALVGTLVVAVRLIRPGKAIATAGPPDGSHGGGLTCLEHPVFDLVFKVAATAILWLALMLAMSLVGDHLHRKGEFSGAGAEVGWSAG